MITRSQRRWIDSVHLRCAELTKLSDLELRRSVDQLRESVFRKQPEPLALVNESLALANEAVFRVLGWKLHDVQLLAGKALTSQSVVQMETGEGKTISALPAAVYGGILGQGVHVATPNAYLASRDYEQLRPVYELLGVSVGLIGNESADPPSAYASDVTYGPGYEFGFDYLRDQRTLKQQRELPAGHDLLQKLRGENVSRRSQRGLGMILVDEVDNVLIDDAMSPQVLSEFQPGEAEDAEAVLLARIVANTLESPLHFVETASRQIQLTPEGEHAVHATGLNIPLSQLTRSWTNYVEAALRARIQFHRDVHYVVRDGEVKIVEQSTGRIFEDRSWQSGLHQAIEAKEGVTITPESLPLARITRQRFFRLYPHLAGMTGTVGDCGPEFKSVYQMEVEKIPLHRASQRESLPFRMFESQARKWDAVVASVNEFHNRQRPVLIGTRTILDSRLLAARLEECGLPYELLNGLQNADEAEVVSRAGQRAAITIATNLAGRGTDIKLGQGVSDLGGLHVIVAECHESYRADRQLIGRCARQGDPGSCQTFVATDDWLIEHHAPWLGRAIRSSGSGRGSEPGEIEYPVAQKIRSIQARLERQRFAIRRQMLDADQRRNAMLERIR